MLQVRELLPESAPNGLVLIPIGLVKLEGLAFGGASSEHLFSPTFQTPWAMN